MAKIEGTRDIGYSMIVKSSDFDPNVQISINPDRSLSKEFYEKLKTIINEDLHNPSDQDIKNIAESYHDRLAMSMYSGNRICDCCKQGKSTSTSIEHDSIDNSKDKSVCLDCYSRIVDYWKRFKPGKISPI
jgi:hypothetical protein